MPHTCFCNASLNPMLQWPCCSGIPPGGGHGQFCFREHHGKASSSSSSQLQLQLHQQSDCRSTQHRVNFPGSWPGTEALACSALGHWVAPTQLLPRHPIPPSTINTTLVRHPAKPSFTFLPAPPSPPSENRSQLDTALLRPHPPQPGLSRPVTLLLRAVAWLCSPRLITSAVKFTRRTHSYY